MTAADSEHSHIMSSVNEKLGPLPVWAWGAIGTAALFGFEWWRGRTSASSLTQSQTPETPGGAGGKPGHGKATRRQKTPTGGKKGTDTGLQDDSESFGADTAPLVSAQSDELPTADVVTMYEGDPDTPVPILSWRGRNNRVPPPHPGEVEPDVPSASHRVIDPAVEKDSDYMSQNSPGRFTTHHSLWSEPFDTAVGGSKSMLSTE